MRLFLCNSPLLNRVLRYRCSTSAREADPVVPLPCYHISGPMGSDSMALCTGMGIQGGMGPDTSEEGQHGAPEPNPSEQGWAEAMRSPRAKSWFMNAGPRQHRAVGPSFGIRDHWRPSWAETIWSPILSQVPNMAYGPAPVPSSGPWIQKVRHH